LSGQGNVRGTYVRGGKCLDPGDSDDDDADASTPRTAVELGDVTLLADEHDTAVIERRSRG